MARSQKNARRLDNRGGGRGGGKPNQLEALTLPHNGAKKIDQPFLLGGGEKGPELHGGPVVNGTTRAGVGEKERSLCGSYKTKWGGPTRGCKKQVRKKKKPSSLLMRKDKR